MAYGDSKSAPVSVGLSPLFPGGAAMKRYARYWVLGSWLLLGLRWGMAAPGFWSDHARGWHWYERLSDKHDHQPLPSIPLAQATPVIAQVKAHVTALKHRAILQPTPAHVAEYIAAQNALSAQSHRFATVWQRVLWANPALAVHSATPLSAVGTQVRQTAQFHANQQALKQLAQRVGLIFFFDNRCLYCQAYAPIIKRLSKRYGFSVMAISPDGEGLPAFPTPRKDNGLMARYEVQQLPTLVMVDTQQPASPRRVVGLLTEDDLMEQLLAKPLTAVDHA